MELFDGSTFVPYAVEVTDMPELSFPPLQVRHPLMGCQLQAGDYTACSLVVPTGTNLAGWNENSPGELNCYNFKVECE